MPRIAQKESPTIGFSEEDAKRLHHPHDDALVVNIQIEDYNMHRVLRSEEHTSELQSLV